MAKQRQADMAKVLAAHRAAQLLALRKKAQVGKPAGQVAYPGGPGGITPQQSRAAGAAVRQKKIQTAAKEPPLGAAAGEGVLSWRWPRRPFGGANATNPMMGVIQPGQTGSLGTVPPPLAAPPSPKPKKPKQPKVPAPPSSQPLIGVVPTPTVTGQTPVPGGPAVPAKVQPAQPAPFYGTPGQPGPLNPTVPKAAPGKPGTPGGTPASPAVQPTISQQATKPLVAKGNIPRRKTVPLAGDYAAQQAQIKAAAKAEKPVPKVEQYMVDAEAKARQRKADKVARITAIEQLARTTEGIPQDTQLFLQGLPAPGGVALPLVLLIVLFLLVLPARGADGKVHTRAMWLWRVMTSNASLVETAGSLEGTITPDLGSSIVTTSENVFQQELGIIGNVFSYPLHEIGLVP